MNHKNSAPQELVSAMADDELAPQELGEALRLLQSSDTARADWAAYHLIGDVMRSSAATSPLAGEDLGFAARFRSRLQQEKARDAHKPEAHAPADPRAWVPAPTSKPLGPTQVSANDAVFRWKMVAGLASVMAVAIMGWHWRTVESDVASSPQFASADSTAQPVMMRDARLDRLLAAHQQNSGISASHMSNGFLRNATFHVTEP